MKYSNFLGETNIYWSVADIDVVIMMPEDGKVKNENTLPHPFDVEDVYGKILLVRMVWVNEKSEPRDFTLEEYQSFLRRDKRLPG